jgi:hypothetical protein
MSNSTRTPSDATHQILAAAFAIPDGASRAATAVSGGFRGRIGNTAILYVTPSGTPKFVETKDWGSGRGALVGGAIGLIGGPLGVLAGSGIGVLASKLRDMGFKDSQLRQLGESLGQNNSAVVFEIATDAVEGASQVLDGLGATQIVVEPIDSSVADLFNGLPTPDVDAA